MLPSASALASFRVRSYRFQWPADLATSWAFEMETLILGWYVLVETGSVFLLTVFASLQHIGTLIAPMFGVVGDRIGARNLLCAMRAIYALLALTVMTLAFTGVLTPVYVLVTAGIMGLVRPSDIGMRAALVGETMPPAHLMSAMGIQRTTMDSARIVGALSGAGLVAALGMGPAYVVVASFYAISVLLTLQTGDPERTRKSASGPNTAMRVSPWRELKEGLIYVRRTPQLLAVMCLAFVLNVTAFPQMNGLLPYVAKQIYQADQTWLGYMVAAGASGALIGSLVLSRYGAAIRAARTMVIFSALWLVMLLIFGNTQNPVYGILVFMAAGLMQSIGQIPMAAMILRTTEAQYRARVMGIRMLAIYGNLVGLLIAGPLIAHGGYGLMATLFCTFGLTFIVMITLRWSTHFWHTEALGNRR
jgi:predicted MFS family arabinose efflux permease